MPQLKYSADDSGNIYRNDPDQPVIATVTSEMKPDEMSAVLWTLNHQEQAAQIAHELSEYKSLLIDYENALMEIETLKAKERL